MLQFVKFHFRPEYLVPIASSEEDMELSEIETEANEISIIREVDMSIPILYSGVS